MLCVRQLRESRLKAIEKRNTAPAPHSPISVAKKTKSAAKVGRRKGKKKKAGRKGTHDLATKGAVSELLNALGTDCARLFHR